jgi:heat shock protein HslJ
MKISKTRAFAAVFLLGCAAAAFSQKEKKTGFTGIDWYLSEIKTAQKTIDLNRAKLESDGMGEFFCIRFDEERFSGIAAPNHYNAPYTLGKDSTLTVGTAAATKMFSFRVPEALKEEEFFAYLRRVNRLTLTPEGRLELSIASGSAVDAVLIFNRGAPEKTPKQR